MFETNIGEKVCPSCKNNFYPEEGVVYKTFCGEEILCTPKEESNNDNDCKTYYFCSAICAEDFEKETPVCTYVPGWKKMMVKIEEVTRSTGLKEIRPYNLHRNSK